MPNVKIDLTGERFGKLTVIEYAGSKNRSNLWRCRCDCGCESIVSTGALRSGNTKSCGCGKMSHFVDLTGRRFGRLVVLARSHSQGGDVFWVCECDCGSVKTISGHSLRRGRTKSCGCLHNEIATAQLMNMPEENRHKLDTTTHGLRHTRLYGVWLDMKNRCYNPNTKAYPYYGGRGIRVCDEWKADFVTFYAWAIENGYDENAKRGDCTLDRIDVDKGYCPENCRWVSLTVQANNKRNNVFVEYEGEKRTASEWADIFGLNPSTVLSRIRKGWDPARAITTKPLRPNNRAKH